jgi:beta-lactamase class A
MSMNEDVRSALHTAIGDVIADFSGEVGIAAKNLHGGEKILVNECMVFPTASSAKIWVLVELFQQVAQGKLALQTRIPLREDHRILGSGVLRDLQPGVEFTLHDLATLMITVSDNTATNILIDLLGIDNIRRTMTDLGLENSRLNNKIDFDLIVPDARSFGEASPSNFVRLLELIAKHQILTPDSCEAIISIMGRNQHLDFAPRWLPYNPLAKELGFRQDIVVANKPGAVTGVRTDVLLVRHPAAQYVAAIMTDGCQDERWNADNEGSLAIARISRLIFDYFTNKTSR